MANEVAMMQETEIEGFRADGCSMIEAAKTMAAAIKDSTTLDAAARLMLDCKTRINRVRDRLKGPRMDARAAWQNWVDLEGELVEPYERIEREIIKPAMVRYNNEQERLRREEENRLREEQRKRAEDERIKAAAKLEKEGEKEAAEELLDAPIEVAPVVVPRAEAPAGISYRDLWRFRVVDDAKLPREYLMVDEKKIGAIVRALKGETRIPGVEVYSEKTVAGRI